MPAHDPRDVGDPPMKAWAEFAASFAAVRVFIWLISEIDDVAPGYIRDLKDRINRGIAAGEGLEEDWPATGGPAMIPAYGSSDFSYLERDEAMELERQLFSGSSDSRDFALTLQHLGVVALHSTLEGFVKARAGWSGNGNLPDFLSKHVPHDTLGQDWDRLVDLDATRHLIIHKRGAVDGKYRSRVAATPYELGELRVVAASETATFAETVWRIALSLHRSKGAV